MRSHREMFKMFRKAAADYHVKGRFEAPLPEFLAFRWFWLMWAIAGAGLALVAFVWASPTPDIAPGVGVWQRPPPGAVAELLVVIPARAPLTTGQKLTCVTGDGTTLAGTISAVETDERVKRDLRQQLAAGAFVDLPADQGYSVARARLQVPPTARESLAGSPGCRVLVTVGSRSLLSYIPGLSGLRS
jgi:hypothetical protein